MRYMEYEDYKKFTQSMSIYPSVGSNFLYPALGLIEELLEAHRANTDEELEKELGDVMFYLTQLGNETGIYISYKAIWMTEENTAYSRIGQLAGKLKKSIRDHGWTVGNPPPKYFLDWYVDNVDYFYVMVSDLYYSLVKDNPPSMEEILDINVAKLTSRKERGVLQGDGDDR